MATSVIQIPGLRIKSIQRGTINLTNTVATGTATITAVDTSKSIVNQTGSQGGNGGSGSWGTLTLTNGTTVTLDRTGTASNVTNVCFEVIEFY